MKFFQTFENDLSCGFMNLIISFSKRIAVVRWHLKNPLVRIRKHFQCNARLRSWRHFISRTFHGTFRFGYKSVLWLSRPFGFRRTSSGCVCRPSLASVGASITIKQCKRNAIENIGGKPNNYFSDMKITDIIPSSL